MAGIKDLVLDTLNRLNAMKDDSGIPIFKHVRVWNNQVQYERDGQLYNFPKPAAFVEIVSDAAFQTLGGGVQAADIGVRVHIVHEQFDAMDNTFEQNVEVFNLRDYVVRPYQRGGLSQYQPPGCGPLAKVTEAMDYEHDNIYEYVIDFLGYFTDSTSSKYDPVHGSIKWKEPPTDLEVIVNPATQIDGVQNDVISRPAYEFRIPKK